MRGQQGDTETDIRNFGSDPSQPQVKWCGRYVDVIPRAIWEEGPGQRYALMFTGHQGAEAKGILVGASTACWDCPAGNLSPRPANFPPKATTTIGSDQ